MSPTTDPKKEKAEVMALYHSDGGLDLIAGAVLLNFGLDILNQATTTSLFTWIPILLLTSMKNRFTLPRLGVKALKANEKIVKSWAVQSEVGLAIWLLLISTLVISNPYDFQDKLSTIGSGDIRNLVLGAAGGLAFALAAWRIPLPHFYIYGGVLALTSLISYFFLPVSVPVFITGIVMVVYGIKLTMTFSKIYPEPEKDKKGSSKESKK